MEPLRGCSWGCQQSLGEGGGAGLAGGALAHEAVCWGLSWVLLSGSPRAQPLSRDLSSFLAASDPVPRAQMFPLPSFLCPGDSLTCSLDPFCFVLGSGTSHVASFACLPLNRSGRPGEPRGWRGTSCSHTFSQALACIPSHLNLSSTFEVIRMITYR